MNTKLKTVKTPKPTTYYFWKWADNDLPGKPAEVHAALLRGKVHPALQHFDARPLMRRLGKFAASGRKRGEHWELATLPGEARKNAIAVHASCPPVDFSQVVMYRFAATILPLEVSGYDVAARRLISCLPPKLNCFIPGQPPSMPEHDITEEDLPVLLRKIRPGRPEPWGELWNRRNDAIVAIAEGRRFRVEWATDYQPIPPCHAEIGRARDAQRLKSLDGKDDTQALPQEIDPGFLTYTDALNLFRAFMRGEKRPPQYCWRKLKNC